MDVPKIPDSWVWTHLGIICDLKGGVTKGRNLAGKHTISLPYLRVANVQDGYLNLKVIKNIDIPIEEKDKYLLRKGDILFTEGGDRDKLGRGTLWNEEIHDCIHQNHIFRARVINSEVLPEFISLITKSPFTKEYFFDNANQIVNLASINITVLKNTPISIPPLKEQVEIINIIQHLFKVIDKIGNQIQKVDIDISKLTQAILTKTFQREIL
jgi:type I restriction enzyme S subunit